VEIATRPRKGVAVPTSVKTSIQPQFRTIDGLKIRFAESEQRDDHPTPG
jgi:hypothetical protein